MTQFEIVNVLLVLYFTLFETIINDLPFLTNKCLIAFRWCKESKRGSFVNGFVNKHISISLLSNPKPDMVEPTMNKP